jgi:ABC-type multidrug transport system ATPase subunit
MVHLNPLFLLTSEGEMLLVLGRPGSGCSSLLRVIANQRDSFLSVNGDVFYGGLSATEFKHYRGEAIYTPEEDCHNPFLTVEQTLDFALRCKTPRNRYITSGIISLLSYRLPSESASMFRDRMIKLLTRMFGLQKQVNTVHLHLVLLISS